MDQNTKDQALRHLAQAKLHLELVADNLGHHYGAELFTHRPPAASIGDMIADVDVVAKAVEQEIPEIRRTG
jgi:hypothetical protein